MNHRNKNTEDDVVHLKNEKLFASSKSSQDKRIFSFKYHMGKVFWRIGTGGIAIFACYAIVFGKSKNDEGLFWLIFNQVVGGIGLQVCVLVLLDAIFTKEIILYPDKISKTWHFGLRRDVMFTSSRFGAMKTAFFSSKRFYPSWYNNVFTLILGVLYDETLARKRDISLMNKYLADVSGRDLSVFESGVILTSKSISLKSFLKKENTHE